MRRIDRRAFRKWLSELAPDEEAGIGMSGECCPLAVWLQESPDARFGASVALTYVTDRYGDHRRRLPAWAREFVSEVDAFEHDSIPAALALDCLAAAERRIGVRP